MDNNSSGCVSGWYVDSSPIGWFSTADSSSSDSSDSSSDSSPDSSSDDSFCELDFAVSFSVFWIIGSSGLMLIGNSPGINSWYCEKDVWGCSGRGSFSLTNCW